ncbi:NupC/NupG family nucleoside CNT transporter [Nocardiopsis sp. RSe5-2]|uniref:NupC/NupG family nucleoside CNT transporter n=1 Tax=Nocardiopsis endophytica TaxID=3018445 RepID=A0ABT4U8A4_9ACTN|nr:nucleoside transporter C-terminal domain-containing protein [Nocardiopsis endophytica]MDA2812630.1 NupC/NupG family nucleoside CNT transporter [Nocardiopsis endophytica]
MDVLNVLWGIGGMLVILAIAFAFSTNRRAIRPRTVLGALAVQVVFGVLVLYTPWGKSALQAIALGFQSLIDASGEGIDFLFGAILPEEGTVFAFQVLPVVIFVSSLTAVLYYLNILQWVVRIIGGGLQKVLGTGKAESMNATANIFLGLTEAPLVIRPYLTRLTRSELFAVMVGGLATVAGSVLVGYYLLGASMEYLIAAAFMAAPAGLMMAKIIIPETEKEVSDLAVEGKLPVAEVPGDGGVAAGGESAGSADEAVAEGHAHGTGTSTGAGDAEPGATGALESEEDSKPHNLIDAAARGATEGLKLALNIGAMLLAFISLVALLNMGLGALGGLFGMDDLSFQKILGWVFSPLMFVIGVPWSEAVTAGGFLGQKLILNEFVAFLDFTPQMAELSDKTVAIVTFTITGFANVGSLAVLLGGLGNLAPNQRKRIAKLGVRAIIAGTLANLMSAAIAGILIG